MKLISKFISILFSNKTNDQEIRETFIIYRIVDSTNDGKSHKIQCINTRNIFELDIKDIVYNNDILYGLPPIQTCGIGIHFAKLLTSKEERINIEENLKSDLKSQSMYRYGKYCLQYQDRNGRLFYIDTCTEEGFFKLPSEIALSKNLINDFDASQAFHIGFSAGLMMRNASSDKIAQENFRKLPSYLRVVK